MSTYHIGVLAYGIDLGTSEDVKIEQLGEYDEPDLPWMKRDDAGFPEETLDDAITRRLYELMPEPGKLDDPYDMRKPVKEHYGVEVLAHGWLYEGDSPSWILAAYEYRVNGGDVLAVDPYKLISQVAEGGYDAKLNRALQLLEITPTEPVSRWLLAAER